MNKEMIARYKDKEYCNKELLLARKVFGSTGTTRVQYDAMEKALGFLYLYCPDDMTTTVQAVLLEASYRRPHFELNIWPAQGEKV